jgi:hypothetical protein
MTATFNCPQCGAPLSFEPEPGDETVECSFCQTSVIIPEDLRIPLPKQKVERAPQATKQRSGMVTFFMWIGILAVVIFVINLIGSFLSSSGDTPANSASFSGKSATAEVHATDTAQAALDATAAVETQATTDALQTLLKQEQSWPASFSDKFIDLSHGWKAGDVRDDYVTGNRSIADGSYTWNVSAVKPTSYFSFPDMPVQNDFYASVELRYAKWPDDPDADSGLFFRYNETDQSMYYFSINNQGQYYFGWYDGKDWHTLIHESDSSAIHPGQTNQIAVGVKGSQFIFVVNGQMIDHFIDNTLKSGTVGLGVNLPTADEKGVVVFSKFTVLSTATKP